MCCEVQFYKTNNCNNIISQNINSKIKIEEYTDENSEQFQTLVAETSQFFNKTHYYYSLDLNNRLCNSFYIKWIQNDINGRKPEHGVAADSFNARDT